MTRWIAIAGLTIGVLLVSANDASAQLRPTFGRPGSPTTSPWLNLLNRPGGGGILFNYYQRVRPEMEFRGNNANLARSVNDLSQQINQQQALKPGAGLGQTGHAATFMNLGGYFSGVNGQQQTGAQIGGQFGGGQFGRRR